MQNLLPALLAEHLRVCIVWDLRIMVLMLGMLVLLMRMLCEISLSEHGTLVLQSSSQLLGMNLSLVSLRRNLLLSMLMVHTHLLLGMSLVVRLLLLLLMLLMVTPLVMRHLVLGIPKHLALVIPQALLRRKCEW